MTCRPSACCILVWHTARFAEKLATRRFRAAGGESAVRATVVRALVGAVTVAAVVVVAAAAVGSFRNSFADTVPLTVMSPRAGLVMNPDAKVKLLGVPVGRVGSIEERPGGQAAIHLEMDPEQLAQIPDNVIVDIASPTVFGAKSVDLVPPPNPSPLALRPGQVLDSEHVTVEFNLSLIHI